jgi:hypothetical protein
MKWIKKGLVFAPDNNYDWMVSHAQAPIVDKVNDDVLRIYFGTRDKLNRTVTTYIEVEADNPQNILYCHDKPVLGLGKLGCFDDSGAMPSWIVNYGGVKYLYYIGWNVSATVPYRLSIGLAVGNDDDQSFARLCDGPIMDRVSSEPHWCAAPCAIVEDGIWKMWYISCVKWEVYNGKPEPYYHIRYAESADGINWDRRGIICVDFRSSDEVAISRPCVVRADGIYRMWYAHRGIKDYRKNKEHSYRIGYAESFDGIEWTRKDETVGIDVSENGWDSIMIAYPYVYKHKGRRYMIYNGNGFGRSGFGYAVLEE